MPLQGNLKEMSLANLVQVNCQEMRSAHLTLDQQGQKGEVYLSDGQVVHAALYGRTGGKMEGEEALYRLLSWDAGTFTLETETHPPQKTIDRPWQELLLEAMKRLAEWQSIEPPAEAAVTPDVLSRLCAIDGVEGAVITASDGVVLAANMPGSDGEREAAVAVFVGAAAQQMGNSLELGNLTQATVTLKARRVLILAKPDRYVGLWLGTHVSPTIVGNSAAQILAAARG